MNAYPLEAIFKPRSVAVIGATEREGSVGRTIVHNLLTSPFGGRVYPINSKYSSVLGAQTYAHVGEVPEQVDLAVIVTPAKTVPGAIGECVAAGVRGVVVISAGFKEHGEHGKELEREILRQMQGSNMRLIGPNCVGVMNPITGLNATFVHAMARPGNVAFISQSGALCAAVLDWSLRELVGFSAFVSVGSMLDVDWGDLIDYLGNDPHTRSILIYMKSVGDAREFLSAAREISLSKPIIVIKAGRTEAAAHAAASHTGSLTGSDEVLEAAFRRCGVLRVNTIADLFYLAEVLASQPRPKGPRLTILKNAGGPGVLATDALISSGAELARLSPESMRALDELLPPHWSHNNPVDVLGDASPQRYAKALEIVSHDPNADGILAILCPQGMADPTETAIQLAPLAQQTGKPLLAALMGGDGVREAGNILKHAGIPTFTFPETASRVFNYMWRYNYNLKTLYETPFLWGDEESAPDRKRVQHIVDGARRSGRTILTEVESKQVLAAYSIPVVTTLSALTEDEAVERADDLGYPVVIKLLSQTVTHKTDVGGVQLNLSDAEAVRKAFCEIKSSVCERAGANAFLGVTVQPFVKRKGTELIIGSSLDQQFGPILLFGAGGELVEVFKDRALALPPLNTTLARSMMEQTRIYTALHGVRGRRPVDISALEDLMVRFSQLVVEQAWIRAIDINPLLATSESLLALDARVILHGPEVQQDQIPGPAIRPYPIQYAGPWRMKNGSNVTIRPIRPEDEPMMVEFHKALSDRSVYMRYFQPLKLSTRTAHDRLTRICFIDYEREMALVVESRNACGEAEILAVGRLSKLSWINEAEAAVIVRDEFHNQGLGTELYRRLIHIGRAEKLRRITSTILAENQEMRALCQKLGFHLRTQMEDNTMTAILDL